MKTMKKVLCFIMVAVMMVAMMPSVSEAAGSVKLNKKKVTLTITNKKKNPKVTLKIKGVSKKKAKKAKWTTSNKKVATVKKGKVTAKKAGKATITCKVRGKKYKCRITVKDKRKSAKNGSLNITIKDMGPVSMENRENLKRLQDTGDEQAADAAVDWDWLRDSYTEKQINNFKRSKEFFRAGRQYIVNSQIIVTYNGKDVTDKAQYHMEYSDKISSYDTVVKDGIMDIADINMATAYDNPKLVVSYNGVKKKVPLKITEENRKVAMCYCGELFESPESANKHDKAVSPDPSDSWAVCCELLEVHGGSWGFEYSIITMKIE